MKYVKQFDEHDDYTLYVEDDPVLPNVSKCDAERHVHYNPKFVSVPLTFDIKSDGVIKWTAANDASPLTIKYSKNGGEWEPYIKVFKLQGRDFSFRMIFNDLDKYKKSQP